MAELSGVNVSSTYILVRESIGLLKITLTNTTGTTINGPLEIAFDMPIEVRPSNYASIEVQNSGVATTHVVGRVYDELTPIPPGKSINVIVRLDSDADELSSSILPTAYTIESENTSDDTTPPATPTNLHWFGVTSDSVALGWDPITDADVDSYHVIWGSIDTGPFEATVRGTSGIVVTNLILLKPYWFDVRAVDKAGNESASASIQAYTTE